MMPKVTKVKKRSVILYGHKTSISIEDEFWLFLKKFAKKNKINVYTLIERIDKERKENTLSSSIRLFCFNLALNTTQ